MRKVMLSIIVMLAVLAGIPAMACWFLDAEFIASSPGFGKFVEPPPTEIVPPIQTSETTYDAETGVTTTVEIYDNGIYRHVKTVKKYIDPATGNTVIEEEVTGEGYWAEMNQHEVRRQTNTMIISPTGEVVYSAEEGDVEIFNKSDLPGTPRQSVYSYVHIDKRKTVAYSDGGSNTISEVTETTKNENTETLVPILDPDTGNPVLDPETGEPMTESVFSDPNIEKNTIEKEQTITLDPENGVIDSTNTTTTVVVINPSTGTSETTTTTEETTTTTDPETGSTETTTETETQNPDDTTVTESSTKNETVTYDEYDTPIVNWWENRVRTEPYDIVTTNVTTSVDPVTGVTTITTTTTTEHWDGYGWNTTTDTQTETIPPTPLLTTINHVPVRYVADPTTYSTPKTDAPMNIFVRARYYGDYTLHCFEADPSTDADGSPLWSYSWMPAKNTLRRVNGKYQSPQLMLFGRALYPNLSRERNNAFWPDGNEFILSISTSADSLTAWREMMDCCGGVNCKFGRHKRIKLSNVAKPGK